MSAGYNLNQLSAIHALIPIARLIAIQNAFQTVERHIAVRNALIVDQEREIAELRQKITTLEGQLAGSKEESASFQQRVVNLTKELRDALDQHTATLVLHEDTFKTATRQLKALRHEVASLKEEIQTRSSPPK